MNLADADQWRMKCSDNHHFASIKNVLTTLCDADFEVDLISSSRMRRVFKGRCMWTVQYRSVNGNIQGPVEFQTSVDKLTESIPINAEVVSVGRYGGPAYGIVIQYGNKRCRCQKDFKQALTRFRFLESSNILIKYEFTYKFMKAELDLKKFFSGRFDSITLVVTDGNTDFQSFIQQEWIENIAQLAVITKSTKCLLLISEVKTSNPRSNFSRATNIANLIYESFDSNDINSTEISLAFYTIPNDEFKHKCLPSVSYPKNMIVKNYVLVDFSASCNDKNLFCIGFLDFSCFTT